MGRHAEPVLVALRILARGGAEPRRDRGHVGAVTAAVRGVRVRGVVAGVADASEQVRVDEGGASAIQPRVRHVDGEPEGGSEPLRGQPCLVARTARREAGEVAGHDLRAALVVQLRHAGRLDRDHRRIGGERAHLGRAQVEELRADPRRRQLGGELVPSGAGVVTCVLTGGSRHGLDRHAAASGPALDLVLRSQRRGGAHRRVGAYELTHAVEGVSRRVHDVSVLGGVAEDGRARPAELRQPLLLHRPHELHEHERLTALGRVLARQRGPRGGIDLAAGERHAPHVVAAARPGAAQELVVLARRFDEREVAVAGDHARVRARESELATRRIGHHEQVQGGVRAY